MGDSLEKFVLENRHAFDDEEPRDDVWDQIRRHNKKPGKYTGWWKVAAVIFLLSSVGLLVERQWAENDTTKFQANEEFFEVERFYSQVIQTKRNELLQTSNHPLKQDFLKEIDQLDQQYLKLRKTFKDQPSSEKLTNAMISNLKLRIEILNKQLDILNQLKDYKDETIIEI